MLSQPRKILLTGGTSGIGRCLVDRLTDAGHQVVVLGRSEAALAALQTKRPSVAVYRCDLSRQQDIEDAAQAVWSDHPDISVLINNAGVQFTPQLHQANFRYDSISYETAVNFLAPVWLSYLSLPGLLSASAWRPCGQHHIGASLLSQDDLGGLLRHQGRAALLLPEPALSAGKRRPRDRGHPAHRGHAHDQRTRKRKDASRTGRRSDHARPETRSQRNLCRKSTPDPPAGPPRPLAHSRHPATRLVAFASPESPAHPLQARDKSGQIRLETPPVHGF